MLMSSNVKIGLICYVNHEISVIRQVADDEVMIEVIRLDEVFSAKISDLTFPKYPLTEHEILVAMQRSAYRYLIGMDDELVDTHDEPYSTCIEYMDAKCEATIHQGGGSWEWEHNLESVGYRNNQSSQNKEVSKSMV